MSFLRAFVALHVLMPLCIGPIHAAEPGSVTIAGGAHQMVRPSGAFSPLASSSSAETIPVKSGAYQRGIPYITKLPRSGPIRIAVFGDSLGRGLVEGMRWVFSRDRSVKIINGTRPGTGLARNDLYNWPKRIRRALKRHTPHIAVVLIGGNDRQDMRLGRTRLERFSKEWFLEYRRRTQKVMGLLHKAGVPTYWVALPNVQSRRMSRDFRWFNDLFALETSRHGFVFLNKLDRFSNNGKRKYRTRGLDINGRKRRLRQRDGMHFTLHGNRLLAAFVGKPIKADILKSRKYQMSKQAGATAETADTKLQLLKGVDQ